MSKLSALAVRPFIFIVGLVGLTAARLGAADDSGGVVRGQVLHAASGRAIAGATVTTGTISAKTDLEGRFSLNGVPLGAQNILVTHEGFQPTNEPAKVDVALPASDGVLKMEQFSVSAEVVASSDIGLLSARQKSMTVSDAIGSDQFGRLALSNAADALGKVTGASVVDGKYVLIRGLGDRYSNTLLNGVAVPTADPDKRAVQMDQFPSDLLESIVTSKSFTPDQPGAFSGGSVNIRTKSFPERFFFSASSSVEINESTTRQELLGVPGGLAAAPAIPAEVPSRTLAEISARQGNFAPAEALDTATRSFSGGGLFPRTFRTEPDLSLALALGNRHAFGEEGLLGYIASVTAKREFSHYEGGEANRFVGNPDAPQSRLLLSRDRGLLSFDPATAVTAPPFGVSASTETETRGAFGKIALRPSLNHEVSLDLFYNRTDDINVRRGVGEEANNYVGSIFEVYDILSTERSVGSAQLAGRSLLPALNELQLDWRASFSRSTQDQPDYRTLAAIYAPDGTFVNATGVQPNRFFRELTEDAREGGLDLTYPFVAGTREHRFKFGGMSSTNERTYREQRFQYTLNPRSRTDFVNFPNPVGILARTGTAVTLGNTIQRLQEPNNYTGEQDIGAAYAMFDAQVTSDLRAIVGLRFESTRMRTEPKALVGATPTIGSIDRTDALPALSLVYTSSAKTNWRFAYGRTIARPTFKELTDIRYEDVFTGDVYLGNPALQLSTIDNFDVRWEWFPRRSETLAVSLFHKRLKNPIEVLYEPSVGSIQPQNVASGTVSGVELEFRRGLRFLNERLASFSVGANLTFIDSAVTIPAREMAILRAYDRNADDKRELLGQSPYVLNVDVSYDGRRSGTVATLSFNVVGERLDLVNFGPLPDVIEEPAPLLNFVVSQRLADRWRLRFSARNLLDPDRSKTIGLDDRDLAYARYSRGRSYSLSLSYLFD